MVLVALLAIVLLCHQAIQNKIAFNYKQSNQLQFFLTIFLSFTMKNLLNTFVLVALISSFFNVFNANAQWLDSGTTVRLATNTDNVGIGTTAPIAKLHVDGDRFLLNTTSTTSSSFINLASGGSLKIQNNGGAFATFAAGATNKYTLGSTGGFVCDFEVNGNSVFNKNVSINSALGSLRIGQTTSGYKLGTLNAGQDLTFISDNNGTTANRVTFKQNGNVGIGTTAPNRELTIEKAGAAFANIKDGTREILIGADATGGIVSVMTNHDLILRAGSNSEKMRIKANGNVGIGTNAPTQTLHVAGNALLVGTTTFDTPGTANNLIVEASSIDPMMRPTANNFGKLGNATNRFFEGHFNSLFVGGIQITSDAKTKTNVVKIDSASDKIAALRGVSYDYIPEALPGYTPENAERMAANTQNHLGFIAQEVERVLPELVKPLDGTDIKTVNYTEIIPVLVEAFKEEKAKNEALEARLAKLEALLNVATPADNPTKAENTKTTVAPVAKIAKGSVAQNHPNPAKDVTSISYAIDKNTANAQIVITDMAGRTLQQINITDGAGNVNINTNNFANGAYIYSLVIDGQTVESKQMVVNK